MRRNCEICGASGEENTLVQFHYANGKISPFLCGGCEKDYERRFFSGRDGERRKMKKRVERMFAHSFTVDGKFIVNAEEYRQMKAKEEKLLNVFNL